MSTFTRTTGVLVKPRRLPLDPTYLIELPIRGLVHWITNRIENKVKPMVAKRFPDT
jgi:hypothetical protein